MSKMDSNIPTATAMIINNGNNNNNSASAPPYAEVYQQQGGGGRSNSILREPSRGLLRSSIPSGEREHQIRQYLRGNTWPDGLIRAFIQNLNTTPIRFMILDDSGSMAIGDGHKLVQSGNTRRSISCSRWTELGDAVRFHVGLAAAAKAPTEFRFLNMDVPIMVGVDGVDDCENVRRIHSTLEQSPSGGTPLCSHIQEVIVRIREMERELRAARQKAVIVIATDGESSDGDMARAMKPLEKLPVWVVVRLSTDDENIVNYWNNIDSELELELDVLDDIESEGKEVTSVNSWLTYCEPIHRIREFGITIKEFDMLDERTLTSEEMHTVIAMLLGGSRENYPYPEVEYNRFEQVVTQALAEGGTSTNVWNPLKKKITGLVDVGRLRAHYGPRGSCTLS